jgi:hypothetical protein
MGTWEVHSGMGVSVFEVAIGEIGDFENVGVGKLHFWNVKNGGVSNSP